MKMMSITMVDSAPVSCILPTSVTAFLWDLLCLFVIASSSVFVPYFLAFGGDFMGPQLAVDAVSTVFFAVDMHLRSSALAVAVEGVLITGKEEIRSHYCQTSLRMDLLSTVPVSAVLYAVTQSSLLYGSLRWLTLLRLRRIPQLSVALRKWISDQLHLRVPSSKGATMIGTVLLFLYTAHLLACLLSFIGKLEQRVGVESWIDANDLQHRSTVDVFATAFYWALYTLSTVGYGSVAIVTDYERAFAIAAMILGSILSALLSAVISSITDSNNAQIASKR